MPIKTHNKQHQKKSAEHSAAYFDMIKCVKKKQTDSLLNNKKMIAPRVKTQAKRKKYSSRALR